MPHSAVGHVEVLLVRGPPRSEPTRYAPGIHKLFSRRRPGSHSTPSDGKPTGLEADEIRHHPSAARSEHADARRIRFGLTLEQGDEVEHVVDVAAAELVSTFAARPPAILTRRDDPPFARELGQRAKNGFVDRGVVLVAAAVADQARVLTGRQRCGHEALDPSNTRSARSERRSGTDTPAAAVVFRRPRS